MCTCFVACAEVIHKFHEDEDVCGVTLLNNELYLLRLRNVDQIQVYSTDDFTLLRILSVPGLCAGVVKDITSCVQKQCIYLANSGETSCIYRVGLDRSVSKWPVRIRPSGLSVTRSSNLLVTCSEGLCKNGKLVELSSHNGNCVREIKLHAVIEWPRHAVQMHNGQYVVCHGQGVIKNQVSQVGVDGRIIRSNIGDGGLNVPSHVSVNSDQFVFVADTLNSRIVLFDPSLNYVRNVLEQMQNMPMYVCFDDATRRLYVGQQNGIVSVVQL